jgi:hypothetical protein
MLESFQSRQLISTTTLNSDEPAPTAEFTTKVELDVSTLVQVISSVINAMQEMQMTSIRNVRA